MAKKPLPTPERVRQLLSYSPDTGHFTWLEKPCRGWQKGADLTAGTPCTNGYVRIIIDGCGYMAHRLAWLISHGVPPTDQIDHINGIKNDNRLTNLREATGSQNQQNRGVGSNNRSGHIGVSFNRRKSMWKAQIKVRGKIYHLGWHDSIETASKAYLSAKTNMHKFSPEPRRA
jgi:hypothetical protein